MYVVEKITAGMSLICEDIFTFLHYNGGGGGGVMWYQTSVHLRL